MRKRRITKAIFVTTNEHKRREVQQILGVALGRADLDLPEVQAIDPAEVAAEKARAAREALGDTDLPVLVEDSGLMVDAWGGFPGALTKWVMKSVGNEGLLRMLDRPRTVPPAPFASSRSPWRMGRCARSGARCGGRLPKVRGVRAGSATIRCSFRGGRR